MQKKLGLSALDSDAGVISFLIPPSSFLEKEKTNHEEAKNHRAGGEGDSSRAHGIPHGTGNNQLHGQRPVLIDIFGSDLGGLSQIV